MAGKLSINHETLRIWARRAETHSGQRAGLTTDEQSRLKQLEMERAERAGPLRS